MSIQILPEDVASQIAAGEVVERPASVVKELIENSIDSGATSIHVRVTGAGRGMIEVADNGSGIPAAELALAVSRHATSKIQSVADLLRIRSLGFRGEALASIGSVSRLTIQSRALDEPAGAELVVDAGRVGSVRPAGAVQGTVVRVEDLFFSVPARLKFLKSDATEKKNIDAFVTRYAVAYPEVRFALEQDSRMVLQTSGNGDRREALLALLEARLARHMLEINAEYDSLRISGYVSPTSETRGSRSAITIFVNGRWVQDSAIASALIQAYHGLLMVGRFPIAFLLIDLSPDAVDVNVHPTKAEVRFQDAGAVFSAVQRAVKRGLLAYTPVPSLVPPLEWEPAPNLGEGHHSGRLATTDALRAGQGEGLGAGPGAGGTQEGAPVLTAIPLLRLIGQIGNTFLVAEGPDGLYLIDQHAAHERVLYERMLTTGGGKNSAQALLQPETIELPIEFSRALEEHLPALSGIGFEIEPFGPGMFQVRALPTVVSGMNPADALRVVVEDFEEDEAPLRGEVEARLIARICKRAAVKAGQALSAEEQKALLRDLEGCKSPRTCPHGRPTMIHISLNLLERQFGRKGAI